MEFPRITIVTPNFNKASYIETTIRSILDQGYSNLEYIVIDGGSSDGSIEIINRYKDSLAYFVSEKDNGLYHALQKGFQHATGDIMGWLNSDDILHPGSLFTIAEIFSTVESVDWVQGHPTVVDDMGRILYNRKGRNNKLDFYKKKYTDGIFIQQESTFWRKRLWEKAGAYVSTEYKYAGDFELWIRFFDFAKLYNTTSIIGAFRLCSTGQLSTDNYSSYLEECDRIIDKATKQLDASTLKLLKQKNSWSFLPKRMRLSPTKSNRVEYDFSQKRFYSSES